MKERLFRFKQFSVCHSQSAMKIGVDGVLLGAWADARDAARVLDVGTGCGVIALQIAQRNPNAVIEAIDIHQPSVEEAKKNFESSPWSDRLNVANISFESYKPEVGFDLIVSNPPFFHSGVDATASSRMTARHAAELSPETLLTIGSGMLAPMGRIALICPLELEDTLLSLSSEIGLSVKRLTSVYGVEGKPAKRLLAEFEKLSDNHCEPIHNDLIISDSTGCYTRMYRSLTGDFYLNF